MRLGDVVLTQGSSSSSSTSPTSSNFNGILHLNFFCDIDIFYVYDLIQTSDGNFLAACTIGWLYCGLIKYNEDGIIWAKAFRIKHEGPNAEGGFVSEIDGYFYASYKFWTDIESYSSLMIYKIDQDGNEIWHRSSYSCWADDYPRGVVDSLDSTSVIWYFTYYDGGGDFSGGYTPVYYKLDKETGNTIWVKGIKNDGYGVYMQMIHTQDNNYLIGHSSYIDGYFDGLYNGDPHYRPMITKVDSNGDKVWSKHYYRKNLYVVDIITSIKLTADGGFIALIDGVSQPVPYNANLPFSYDTLVMKLNSSGVPEWCTKIHDTGAEGNYFSDSPCKIHVLNDGYVFNSYDQNTSNYFLIKLSLTGSFVWGKTIDVENFPGNMDLTQSSSEMTDNGFIIYGISVNISPGESNRNAIISIHTDFDGNIDGCPYILNGVSNTIEEGYVSEIVYETAYISVIEATYLWTFNQPTISTDFDLEHITVCPGVF